MTSTTRKGYLSALSDEIKDQTAYQTLKVEFNELKTKYESKKEQFRKLEEDCKEVIEKGAQESRYGYLYHYYYNIILIMNKVLEDIAPLHMKDMVQRGEELYSINGHDADKTVKQLINYIVEKNNKSKPIYIDLNSLSENFGHHIFDMNDTIGLVMHTMFYEILKWTDFEKYKNMKLVYDGKVLEREKTFAEYEEFNVQPGKTFRMHIPF